MEIGIKVGDVMTRKLVFAKPDDNLIECAKKMVKNRIGSLLVGDKGKLKGMLIEKDIIWALTKKSGKLEGVKAINVAHKKISTIKPSSDIYEALSRMKKTRYRWLPVTEKGRVVGLLTINDILRIQPNLFDLVKDMLTIRRVKVPKESEKEGICDKCGLYEVLYEKNGKLICSGCKDEK